MVAIPGGCVARTRGTRITVVEIGFTQLPDHVAGAYEGNVEGRAMKRAELAEYLDAAA
jgi:hypothetical protein